MPKPSSTCPYPQVAASLEDRLRRLATWVGYQGSLIARKEFEDMPDPDHRRAPGETSSTSGIPPHWLRELEALGDGMSGSSLRHLACS
eukprot:5004101-Amphidinium_carterae.1